MSLSYAGSDLTPLGRLFVHLVENLSGQALMKKAYKRYKLLDHSDSVRFFRNAAIALHLEIDVHPRSLEYIPETGRLIGKRVRLHIGKALSLVTLLVDDSDQQLTDKMRLLVMKEQPSSGRTVLDSTDQLHHPVQ